MPLCRIYIKLSLFALDFDLPLRFGLLFFFFFVSPIGHLVSSSFAPSIKILSGLLLLFHSTNSLISLSLSLYLQLHFTIWRYIYMYIYRYIGVHTLIYICTYSALYISITVYPSCYVRSNNAIALHHGCSALHVQDVFSVRNVSSLSLSRKCLFLFCCVSGFVVISERETTPRAPAILWIRTDGGGH